jgi:hypothetical protein
MLRILTASALAALLVGCANVRSIPTEVAITATPTEQRFGIAGVLRLPAGLPLVLATVDEKKAYCSQGAVAFNPGEGRGACFFDTNGSGYFDKWYMLGTIASFTLDGIHIPYSVMGMTAFNQNVAPRIAAENQLEGQARATCAYQAKVASAMTPGLIPALGTGIAVGDACIDYMRDLGKIR